MFQMTVATTETESVRGKGNVGRDRESERGENKKEKKEVTKWDHRDLGTSKTKTRKLQLSG